MNFIYTKIVFRNQSPIVLQNNTKNTQESHFIIYKNYLHIYITFRRNRHSN